VQGADQRVPTADDIAHWTPHERAEVARILDSLIERPREDRDLRRRRSIVLMITGGGALLLFPWVVYLSDVLPTAEYGGAWRLCWVGFDTMLALTLAGTAWLVWGRRSLAVVGLTASSALLALDAWFDVCLSWGTSEQWTAIITSLVINVPVSAVLAGAVLTLMRRTTAVIQQLRGEEVGRVSIWREHVVMVPPDQT
jgi:hypothetical protein